MTLHLCTHVTICFSIVLCDIGMATMMRVFVVGDVIVYHTIHFMHVINIKLERQRGKEDEREV